MTPPAAPLPTAATRTVALLGDPVSHSLSPRLQNAAFLAAGVDGVYVALRCGTDALEPLLRGLVAAGGAGNVTVPHKRLAADVVEDPTPAVRRTGACNTFWGEDGRIRGDNTDVAGFDAAVRALLGSPAGVRALVLGAGGAARAALVALLDARVDRITLWNRTAERAEAVRQELDAKGRRVEVVPDLARLRREGYDLVVNATSLGLRADDPPPLDLARLRRVGAVLDLVYSPGGTPWVRSAAEAGIRAVDGSEMLLRQGAAAFERWWGVPAPLGSMRAALEER